MKFIALLIFLLPFSLYAETCSSLDMQAEREKINNLNHLPEQARDELLSLKRKVKQAQVYGCIDKILSGASLSLDESEQRIADFYLASLESIATNKANKEEIQAIREQLSL